MKNNKLLFYYTCVLWVIMFCAGCNEKTKSVEMSPEKPSLSTQDLIGKTIVYTYGPSVYEVTIDTDSTLHWEAVAGDEKGVLAHETYVVDEVGTDIFHITWGEENGIGVSQVLDFNLGVVSNHLLRGRNATSGSGKIHLKE